MFKMKAQKETNTSNLNTIILHLCIMQESHTRNSAIYIAKQKQPEPRQFWCVVVVTDQSYYLYVSDFLFWGGGGELDEICGDV